MSWVNELIDLYEIKCTGGSTMKKRRLFPVEKSREALILNVKRNIQENLKITKFHGM